MLKYFLLYLEDGMLIASNIHTTCRNELYYFFNALKSAVQFDYFDHCNNSFSCFVGAHFFRSFENDTKRMIQWNLFNFFFLFYSFFVMSHTLCLCSIDTCSRGIFFTSTHRHIQVKFD